MSVYEELKERQYKKRRKIMLARATCEDNKERKGFYVFVKAHSDDWGKYEDLHMIIENNAEQGNHKINPTTLKYQIGEDWYSLLELEAIISENKRQYHELKEIFGEQECTE